MDEIGKVKRVRRNDSDWGCKIKVLHKGRVNKNDEFYTLRKDVDEELQYYTDYFKDKIVYCNCDFYDKSAFVQYFIDNFERLQLKRIIATGYISDGRGKVFDMTVNKPFTAI